MPGTAADDVASRFKSAKGKIDTYASELSTLKSTLSDLESRAAAFRVEAEAGYTKYVDKSGNVPEMSLSFNKPNQLVACTWEEHPPAVEKNDALLAEYNVILASISTAATTCANGLNGLLTGVCAAPLVPVTSEQLDALDEPMPWGSPSKEAEGVQQSIQKGFDNFVGGTFEGIKALAGFDPVTGDWSLWNIVTTVGGTADFLVSTAALTLTLPASGLLKATVGESDLTDFLDDRINLAATGWGGMVGWDHQTALAGGDGWAKWKEDGVAAGAEVAFGGLSMLIPGVNAAKIGTTAARVPGMVARIPDGVAAGASKAGAAVSKAGSFLTGGKPGVTPLSEAKGLTSPGSPTGGYGAVDALDALDGPGGGSGRPPGSGIDGDVDAETPAPAPATGSASGEDASSAGSGRGPSNSGAEPESAGAAAGGGKRPPVSGEPAPGDGAAAAGGGGRKPSTGSADGNADAPGWDPSPAGGGGRKPDDVVKDDVPVEDDGPSFADPGDEKKPSSDKKTSDEAEKTDADAERVPAMAGGVPEHATAGASAPSRGPGPSSGGADGVGDGASSRAPSAEPDRAPGVGASDGPSSDGPSVGGRAPSGAGDMPTSKAGGVGGESPTAGGKPGAGDGSSSAGSRGPEAAPSADRSPSSGADRSPSGGGVREPEGGGRQPVDVESEGSGGHTEPARDPSSDSDAKPGETPEAVEAKGDGVSAPSEEKKPFMDTAIDQKDAPRKPKPADYEAALARAPKNEDGVPIDPRTGEPLRGVGEDGPQKWELKWDPVAGEFVARNPGQGFLEPGPHAPKANYDPDIGENYASGGGTKPGGHPPSIPDRTWDPKSGEPGHDYVTPTSKKGVEYQSQISGWEVLPDGTQPEYLMPSATPSGVVKFDGHTVRGDPPVEVFLEAKDGYQVLGTAPGIKMSKDMATKIENQVNNQLDALPEGAVLEWHVSDPIGAAAIKSLFEVQDIQGVHVMYTPKV